MQNSANSKKLYIAALYAALDFSGASGRCEDGI